LTVDHGESKGVSPETIVKYFPQLYHMAEADSWESIKEHGLLSTSALLDLFRINSKQRSAIESKHRSESVPISHSKFGTVMIRDQKPMRESDLVKCLINMSPQQWYETLNKKVFFWLTKERLFRLLEAKEYRSSKHIVLTIDTAELLRFHSKRVTLSSLNTGCTRPYPWPRGVNTFTSMDKYPFESRRKYGIKNTIVELTVDYAVRDIAKLVTKVQHMIAKTALETLYER
jgi:hypothetical protein